MAKEKPNSEVYAEILSQIASRAAAFVEGAELFGQCTDKCRFIKDNDVHAYICANNTAKIDIYIKVFFGCNIPDTVCRVQEAIKTAVEKETCYKVTEVNVTVMGVVVSDDFQPEIVHSFGDDNGDDDEKEEVEVQATAEVANNFDDTKN